MKLTIIIPCYNEKNTINEVLKKLNNINLNKQIILVDDCSKDGTKDIIRRSKYKIDKIIFHKKNVGKGGAIISASKYILGDYIVIQDADLEYNPNDLMRMFNKILKKKYQVLYGSRVLGKKRYLGNKDFTSIYRIFANHILTLFSNLINNQNLTDAHTCYKMFKSDIFKKIKLVEKDFAFCPEITTKISNMNIPISEMTIGYKGRSYKEGKKISFKDGFKALFTIIKYSINK